MNEEPETEELTPREQEGEVEEEKSFHSKLGDFIFRLPYARDELNVLRRRVQIMGVPEDAAGGELVAVAHAQAMYETYLVRAPHKFSLDGIRSWTPLLEMMSEVNTWHNSFRDSVLT